MGKGFFRPSTPLNQPRIELRHHHLTGGGPLCDQPIYNMELFLFAFVFQITGKRAQPHRPDIARGAYDYVSLTCDLFEIVFSSISIEPATKAIET
jgi:hypothetical protein